MIRKGEKPLQQISRRLTEYELIKDDVREENIAKERFRVEKEHYRIPLNLQHQGNKQYKILKIDSWRINIDDERNNTIMLSDNSVITVEDIIEKNNQLCIVGKKYKETQDLFTIPGFKSSVLGINIVNEPSETDCWPCEMILCKIFKVACTNGFIVYPIIHTLKINE